MPEKPKRRKNKNKRKNKNNRFDPAKNSNVVNDSVNSELCSEQCDASVSPINEQEKDFPEDNIQPGSTKSLSAGTKENEGSNKFNKLLVLNKTADINIKSKIIEHNQKPEVYDKSSVPNALSYIVESPEQTLKNESKSKLNNALKSKSLDDDDAPKIEEIADVENIPSDDITLALINSNNVLVSDAESDVEWEKTDDFEENDMPKHSELATGTLSIATIPLTKAQCGQTKFLTPETEISLRNYLGTLDLSTQSEGLDAIEIKTEIEHIINREIRQRLRKKGLAEDFLSQRQGPPRILDVIDEEGSSESSISTRRQSHLSEKKSDVEDLEDDVFEDPKKTKDKYAAKFTDTLIKNISRQRQIPQKCVLVGAKLKEPELHEARGDWTTQTLEKLTGAEVVYLTDSSSSTSSIHEICDETDDGAETDVSIRMMTPTIEVTDTESLLKKTFTPEMDKFLQGGHEEIIKDRQSIITNDHFSIQPSAYTTNENEIVVLSTDNFITNLYVKEIDDKKDVVENNEKKLMHDSQNISHSQDNYKYDIEMKVLKCELNNAMNKLIKEVSSDSENTDDLKDKFTRQDSSSSVCSSQCTAKYNPSHSSLNDVSNILHDNTFTKIAEYSQNHTSGHVNDVFEHVTGAPTHSQIAISVKQPLALRDICINKISALPYGVHILEELASVSQRLQNTTILSSYIHDIKEKKYCAKKLNKKKNEMAYYPLPDVTSIETVALETQNKIHVPPLVQPRNSSLKKKSKDEHWTGLPTKTDPVYVCLSPSQKMLMEKTNTVITKEDASRLVDMHKKFVDRRGYSEFNDNVKKKDVFSDYTPIIPFKSQTGSRLLALIRDPSVTSNINSPVSADHKHSLDQLHNSCSHVERMSRKLVGQSNSTRELSSTFKPIPPPRPRKYSSLICESDESSDFTDSSLRSIKSNNKFFHYSTGHLNKEIESDISTIQNMHKNYSNVRDLKFENCPRRPSLPKELCDQQMEYIKQKEIEVEAEIARLEKQRLNTKPTEKRDPRAPLVSDKEVTEENVIDRNNYSISHKRDTSYSMHQPESEKGKLTSVFSSSQEEIHRDKMYSEYITQMAQRQERKQQKVIKITNCPATSSAKISSKSMSALDVLDSKVNNRIEKEFICKARERWDKLGIKDPETEDERESVNDVYVEPKIVEHKIKVIEGGEERDVKKLPSHLQDFVRFTAKEKEQPDGSAVWRPGAPTPPPAPARSPVAPAVPLAASTGPPLTLGGPPPPPPPPVWTPNSAGPSPLSPRKSFRPVHFEETPPARRKFLNTEQNGCTSGSESEGRLRTSQSAPASGLNTLGGSRLPRAQNPTVTLLQKAREGQIPRGSSYLQQDGARLPRDRPSPPRGDPVYALRKEYASEGEGDERGARKMADAQAHRNKIEGICPTTKDGMPVTLRSEVKDPSKWYKKMYDTIHKNKYDDDYVTIRYKSRRGDQPQRVTNKSQYAYFDPRSGYLSEPEGGTSRLGSSWSDTYDSDFTTGPRRRTASVQEERRNDEISSPYLPSNKYSTLASARVSKEIYKNQPGRIENYVPGKSSVVDKEAKQWWDEVMDIFDGQNMSSTASLPQATQREKKDITSAILSKSNMARALKESGYESDSTLVFRRRDETEAPLSPAERRAAYRDLQAGGEPPLRGFRSPAPPKQESPRRYVEDEVNIHYRCPVRHDPLPLVPERELARQQAEHMKRLYREQKRNKYLQENDISPQEIEAFDASMKELQDMQSRRHQDNFTPSQKNILPLNRYDEAEKILAKALYAFNGQTSRELSFRKGDVIHVRRQIDANWYEGELHGRIGFFPYNYVEVIKGDSAQPPRKSIIEGRARAKFDFTAQTNLELPLKKGELVVLTRRIDHNWWEGRTGAKTGIFPDSYVTVLQEPSQSKPETPIVNNTSKPLASPAAHGLLNGTAKHSMGAHSYVPQHNSQALSNAPPATQPLPGYVAKPVQATMTPSERGYGPPTTPGVDLNNTEPLYVDTNAEAIPYRAMYKYRPQNPDELELNEGDTVYVLEQCDDGWYVGSSQRSGRFGTFPGNYVERI